MMLGQGDSRVALQDHCDICKISSIILSYMPDSICLHHTPYSVSMTMFEVAILPHEGATIQREHACLSAVYIADVVHNAMTS